MTGTRRFDPQPGETWLAGRIDQLDHPVAVQIEETHYDDSYNGFTWAAILGGKCVAITGMTTDLIEQIPDPVEDE